MQAYMCKQLIFQFFVGFPPAPQEKAEITPLFKMVIEWKEVLRFFVLKPFVWLDPLY